MGMTCMAALNHWFGTQRCYQLNGLCASLFVYCGFLVIKNERSGLGQPFPSQPHNPSPLSLSFSSKFQSNPLLQYIVFFQAHTFSGTISSMRCQMLIRLLTELIAESYQPQQPSMLQKNKSTGRRMQFLLVFLSKLNRRLKHDIWTLECLPYHFKAIW